MQVPDGKRVEWRELSGMTVAVLVDEEKAGNIRFVDDRPVTERIRTLEDAMEALGQGHPFVEEYIAVRDKLNTDNGDLLAYLKLRIITYALNEGWEPNFTQDECRWYPLFYLKTKEMMEALDEEEKRRAVLRSGNFAYAYSGLVYAIANSASTVSGAYYGARLAFKSEELADYAGVQFREIFADFCFRTK